MLDEYFSFHTVEVFLEQLNHNPRYYSKTVHKDSNYGVYIKNRLGKEDHFVSTSQGFSDFTFKNRLNPLIGEAGLGE